MKNRPQYRIVETSPNCFVIERNLGIWSFWQWIIARDFYQWGPLGTRYSSIEEAEVAIQAWLNPHKPRVVKTFP